MEIKSPSSDLTILPIEINWDFLALIMHGQLMKHGRTQEIKGEFISNQVTFRDCQHISKKHSLEYKGETEENDAFVDEDEDKPNRDNV